VLGNFIIFFFFFFFSLNKLLMLLKKKHSFHFKLLDPMESQNVTIGGKHHSKHTNG
jgi:hypothetical protein